MKASKTMPPKGEQAALSQLRTYRCFPARPCNSQIQRTALPRVADIVILRDELYMEIQGRIPT